jgi:hypothetical protein
MVTAMTKLQDFLNSPLSQVSKMGARARAGDLFGLELECEGRKVDWDGSCPDLLNDWIPHKDGSLRAHHGSCQEWVFNGPVKYAQSVKRVEALFKYFKTRDARLVTSNRTSTHVHFNMGDKNAYQLVNLFILFTILEGLLDNYCGEDRAGNLFCLSSRHAQRQIDWVEDSCFKDFHFGNLRENFRYCSMNIASINKFGTVEFRAMRGLDNEADVLEWLSILDDLCQYGCYKMKNPVTMLEEISVKGPLQFVKSIFKFGNFMKLTKGIDEAAISDSLYQGLRLVQMLAYRVGTEFDQVRLRGPDFWASLSGDEAAIPDVDPKELANFDPLDEGPGRVRRVVGGGQRAVPLGRGARDDRNDAAENAYVAERILQENRQGRQAGPNLIQAFRNEYRELVARNHRNALPEPPVADPARVQDLWVEAVNRQQQAAENGAERLIRVAQLVDLERLQVKVRAAPRLEPIVPALEDDDPDEDVEEFDLDNDDDEDEE